MYFRTRHEATEQELALAEIVTTAAAVIIQNHHDNLKRTKAEEAVRHSEEKLRELNTRLQETDKAKTAFFNNVSHEFRTPLTLLIGPLEEVIKSGKSKMHADDLLKLQFSYRSATRLQKLVTTLLDFARIEAGKLEAYYQPVDFSKTTTELAGNFRSAIEKAGLKYVVKAEQIAEVIYLNREMWEKIVFNLLSNAFKFTHKGKIEVIIREKKKSAELHIKDTGTGIASKDIHRIFDRFTRIEGTNARTNEGTGIGLALVRELVNAHGGSIKVKSVQGVGSEFIVAIPKGKAHFAKHQIFENRERQPPQDLKDSFAEEILGWLPEDVRIAKRNLKRYQKDGVSKILIVEDNADMRDYLTTVLSEDDHKIFAMEDGLKVLAFLEQGGHADLILADVMMPVMDGFEMIKKLKPIRRLLTFPSSFLPHEHQKIQGSKDCASARMLTSPNHFQRKNFERLCSRVSRGRIKGKRVNKVTVHGSQFTAISLSDRDGGAYSVDS
jgi:signal transduction histidine kinase/CheY-like chemotaxis protein